MTKPRRKERTSLFRRLFYFVIVLDQRRRGRGLRVTGSSRRPVAVELVTGKPRWSRAPRPTARWSRTSSTPSSPAIRSASQGCTRWPSPRLSSTRNCSNRGIPSISRPGCASSARRPGRDALGCQVVRIAAGRGGKDELTAGWPDRPFQVEWNPGDQFVLEVYDARMGLFIQPRRFTLAQAETIGDRVSPEVG